jgi:hypothetical protein
MGRKSWRGWSVLVLAGLALTGCNNGPDKDKKILGATNGNPPTNASVIPNANPNASQFPRAPQGNVGVGAQPNLGIGAQPGLGAQPGAGFGAQPGAGFGAQPGAGPGGLGAQPGAGIGAQPGSMFNTPSAVTPPPRSDVFGPTPGSSGGPAPYYGNANTRTVTVPDTNSGSSGFGSVRPGN